MGRMDMSTPANGPVNRVPGSREAWLALALSACGASETGPDALVGVVLDPVGAPMAGVEIHTLETAATTDLEGRFTIPWKAPDQHVIFELRGTTWRRTWQPGETGVTTIRLPQMRDVAITCAVSCDLLADWDLGGGLTARAAARCDAGGAVAMAGVPTGAPTVQCRGGEQVAWTEREGGAGVLLDHAPRAVDVTVDGPPPEAPCLVRVGAVMASRTSALGFQATVAGPAHAEGRCIDQPTSIASIDADDTTVQLRWSATPPRVTLPDAPREARLVGRPTSGTQWTANASTSADGVLSIPPIDPGVYVLVSLDGPLDVPVPADWPVGVWKRLDPARWIWGFKTDVAVDSGWMAADAPITPPPP